MKYAPSALEISVSDNGKGFILPAIGSGNGAPAAVAGEGLSNMRQRLQDIGGRCVIESCPGKGTSIRFVLPLNEAVTQAKENL